MRLPSVLLVLLVSACQQATPPDLLPPLVDAEERPLVAQTVPGDPPQAWPPPVAYTGGHYLVPYRGADGLHALVVAADGSTDLLLDSGSLVGVTAYGDRFVVVTSVAGTPTVHLIDTLGDHPLALTGAGTPAAGVASDDKYVLVLTNGGAPITAQQPSFATTRALLVGAQTVEIDLGSLPLAPTVWGDAQGFIVNRRLLLDASGAVSHAPVDQLDGARLFHDPSVAADRLTLDGKTWLDVDAPAGWATATADGFAVALPDASGDGLGQRLLRVGKDLTPLGAAAAVPRSTKVPGWLRALRGDRALWEAVEPESDDDGVENDHLFAVLDATSLVGQGSFVRVRNASSRTVAVALGDTNVLLAFLAEDGSFEISLYDR